jgi:hypothetical protein
MNAHLADGPAPSAEMHGVTLAYRRGPRVLDDLNWRLLPGQVIGLLGRNGAGKTTLLEALLGLREPQSGRVRLFGEDAAAPSDALRARIGWVPQQSDLFGGLTATQMLRYFRSFYPRWNEARVEGLMSRWEIPRWPTSLICWCSTSRCRGWIRPAGATSCASWWSRCSTAAPRSCSRPTSCRTSSVWPSTSRS